MTLPHKLFEKIDGRSVEMIFNIDSAAVTATLVYFQSGESPAVLAQVTKDMRNTVVNSQDDLFDAAFELLQKVAEEIILTSHKMFLIDDLLKDHQQIQKIHISLGSPFTHVVSHKETINTESKQQVDAAFINSQIVRDIPQGMARLDTMVASVHTNGYHTKLDSIVDTQQNNLEISFLDIFARFDHMETLFQLLTSIFNVDQSIIDFIPIESALLLSFQEQYKPKGSYALLHVLGNTSTCSIYNDNKLVDILNIESGFNTVQKKALEQALVANPEGYVSMVRAYVRGHLHEKSTTQLSRILQSEIGNIEQFIGNTTKQPIPQDVFVFSDREIATALVKNINEKKQKRAVLVEPNIQIAIRNISSQSVLINSSIVTIQYVSTKERKNILV